MPTETRSRRFSAWMVVPLVERRHRLIEELRLAHGRPVPAKHLAAQLGVSVRTVERDLTELVEAGVPIKSRRGPGGGYRIALAPDPAPLALSLGEIAALIASLVAIGPYSSATAQSALAKLVDAACE